MIKLSAFVAVTACAICSPTMPASAEEPSPILETGDAPRAGGALDDEIIVTARKRQESILKVPVIENVITAAQLDQRQVTNLLDIGSITPGVILGTSAVEVGTQISIRGIGTTALDPGIDQSISLNLDGLQVSQGSAYSVGVFDMAQVEVLKGPQALFFGKNSPGGVVSIRTNDPGKDFEVTARVSREFVADETRAELILSGPVTDTLGVRLAALYADYGGFFRNVATPVSGTGAVLPDRNFGATKTLFLRGTVVFKPVPDLSARLKLNYTRDREKGGAAFQEYSCPDGLGAYAGIPFFSSEEDCKVDRKLAIVDLDPRAYGGLINDGRPFTNITQKFGTLEVNYDPSANLTLTSVTGYYNLHTEALFNPVAGAAGPAIAAQKSFKRDEVTQEFRLNSDFATPLNFTVGGFYQRARIDSDALIAGNTLYQLPPRLLQGTHRLNINSVSIFGQLRYRIVEALELSGGVRWTDERRSDRVESVDLFGLVTGTPGNTFLVPQPKLRSRNWSPELTLTYTPRDNLTLFGSLKQGYKSGSYNLVQPLNPGENNSFGDEKVQGGELGTKMRLADRQLLLNLAGYYYRYSGLQVGGNEQPPGSVPIVRTLNAGRARVYGVDFDMFYRPKSILGLELRGSANWNRAYYTRFDGAPCSGGQTIAEGCNQNLNPTTGLYQGQSLTGYSLIRAPRWQLNAGANYGFQLNGGMRLLLGVDGQYSSKYFAALGNRDDFYIRKFAKLNANVALSGVNDAWEVALIGNNLTNKLTSGFCGNGNDAGGQIFPGLITGGIGRGPGGVDELHCTFDRGRQVSLRLTLRPTALLGPGRSVTP